MIQKKKAYTKLFFLLPILFFQLSDLHAFQVNVTDTLAKKVDQNINGFNPNGLRLLEPSGSIEPRSPLDFLWTNVSTQYTFQLSEDETFTNVIRFAIIDGNSFSNVVSHTTDFVFDRFKTYYWQVSTLEGNTVSSSFTISLPSEVTLITPTNNETINDNAVSLFWEAQEAITAYQVQVSEDSFNTVFVNRTTASTSMDVNVLSFNASYSWRVRARTTAGWGEWSAIWNFSTRIGDVIGVEPLSPDNNSSDVSLDATLRFSEDPFATSYQIQLSRDAFNSILIDDEISNLFYQLSALSPNTTYYWRVRSKNSFSTSEWSDVFTFTTRRSDVQTVRLFSPTNNAIVPTIQPTLFWNVVEDADNYRVQLSSNNFNSTIVDSTQEITTLTAPTLSYNTSYQWRVKALNNVSESEWSEPWLFTTRIGDVNGSQLILPKNDSTNTPTNLRFQWSSDENASTYQIQISDNDFNSSIIDQETSDTFFNTSSLESSTVYWWRVRAKNNYSVSEWSESRTFSTRATDLSSVLLVSPSDDSLSTMLDVSFRWRSTENADNYRFQLSTDSFFSTIVDEILSDTSIDVSSLSFDTHYEWRVKALNEVDEADWSESWTLITRIGDVSRVEQILPADESILDFIAPNFVWKQSPFASSYNFELSDDEFISTIVNETLVDTSYQSVDLENGKRYQWRVRAINEYGMSDWSVYSFEIPITTTIYNEIPYKTSLDQNYPNPFNPTTQINYELHESSTVLLEVYNMSGERVAQLVNNRQNAGQYSVSFHASNLPSGMYIYRLIANGSLISRKMLLIK